MSNIGIWLTLIAIIGILYLIQKYCYEIMVVRGTSMLPTYNGGELVLIRKFNLRLKKDDIIVVKPTENSLAIKRVFEVKDSYIYVLGDNLSNSLDSRSYGWLKIEQVEGKVVKSWQRK